MTKASVLPLPVTCKGGGGFALFHTVHLKKTVRTAVPQEELTASAATSLLFMNRGMVAD